MPVAVRNKDGIVEQTLKTCLAERLEDIKEKRILAIYSREYFGEEMYKKLQGIDEIRNDALSFNTGNTKFMFLCNTANWILYIIQF